MAGAGQGRQEGNAATGSPTPVPIEPASYSMRMTVELWFGETHIGVRGDSPRCQEFLRYANTLLEDFREAKRARD